MIEIPNSKKIQMRYYLSILVTTIFLLIVSQEIYAETIEYPNANIYYEKSGIIYSYNTKTNKKQEILQGHYPLLSHDKTKFIYFPYLQDELPKGALIGSFYLYNTVTKEKQFLFSDDREDGFGYHTWSPGDRYIVFDAGTSPYRDKPIFDIFTKKIIAEIFTFEDSYKWISNEKIMFLDASNYETSNNKKSYKMIVLDVLTTKKHELGEEETQEEMIRYIEEPSIDNPYYQPGELIKQRETINKILPKIQDRYLYFNHVFLSTNNDWVLLEFYPENRSKKSLDPIYIMNIKNPKSLRKIDDGINATW